MSAGVDPFDYLQGRTPFCQTDGCGRRTLTPEMEYCHSCKIKKDRPRYQSEMQKEVNKSANKKWFYEWNFADDPWASENKVIACACCNTRFPAEEYGEYRQGKFIPYISCCPLTDTCHAAKKYWGKGNKEPALALRQYLKELKAASTEDEKHEQPAASKSAEPKADLPPIARLHVAQDSDEGEDADYIDLRRGRRRTSLGGH